jgi:hypothetical protein
MAVGLSVPRIDGVEKVTGAAKFTGDLFLPGLLEAKVLRSPMPHAVIESIDASKAEALPGVAAILTRDDLHDIDPYYGNCLRDRAVVAVDRVRFVGEPVAVVAVEDPRVAEQALALIEVRYKELPCVPDMDAARAEGAPLLHENLAGSGEFHDVAGVGEQFGGNICHRERFVKGDPDRAFAQAGGDVEKRLRAWYYWYRWSTLRWRVTPDGIMLWSSSAHPLVRSNWRMFHYRTQVEVIVPSSAVSAASPILKSNRWRSRLRAKPAAGRCVSYRAFPNRC